MMHELGHVLGLHHTFYNCEVNDESCLTDPLNCSETVNQNNCNISGPLTCKLTGDGICDTPAHSNPAPENGSDYPAVLLIDTECSYINNPWVYSDRCGETYIDPNNVLITNYMAYYNYCRNSFTGNQVDQMLDYSNMYYQDFVGSWDYCITEPVIYSAVYNEDASISNQTIYVDDLIVNGVILELDKCHLKIKNRIVINDGGTLIIKNKSTLSPIVEKCSNSWEGIIFESGGKLVVSGSKIIKANKPISGEGSTFISLHRSEIEDTWGRYAIDLRRNSNVSIDQCVIDGGVNLEDIYYKTLNVKYSKFQNGLVNSFAPALNTYHANINLYDVEITDFDLGMIAFGGVINIEKLHMKNILFKEGIYTSLTGITNIENSIFEGADIVLEGVGKFNIENNLIEDCFSYGLSIDSDSNSKNFVNKNIFKNQTKGIKEEGNQKSLKFLCNKFENISVEEFAWEGNVNQIQGVNLTTASGNLFSSPAVISGQSDYEIRYNFGLDPIENPTNYTNTSLAPVQVSTPATCNQIGPNWSLTNPTVVIEDDYLGPCPPGIDCTQPCPTGIDCTQPCPLGIDCTQPCPTGIDCTQPCPFGMECYDPINNEDPILLLLNDQYHDLVAELDALQVINIPVSTLNSLQSQIFNNQGNMSTTIINGILSLSPNVPIFLVHDMIENNHYINSNFFNVLFSNPVLMLDEDISIFVWGTSYFDSLQKDGLRAELIAQRNSSEMGKYNSITSIEEQLSRIALYAIYRTTYTIEDNVSTEILWLNRDNSIGSQLKIVDLFMQRRRYSEAYIKMSELKLNAIYTQEEILDIIEYEKIILLLENAENSSRSIDILNNTELDDLYNYASSNLRFSSLFAKNILEFYYDYSPSSSKIGNTNIKISSKDNKINEINKKVTSGFNIFPNPNSGQFYVQNTTLNGAVINIYNLQGKLVTSKVLNQRFEQLDIISHEFGVYLYNILGRTGKVLKSGKVIIR